MSRISFNCLPAINLQNTKRLNIPNLRVLGNNCLAGSALQNNPANNFALLRKLGIDTVVDFREDAPKIYEEICKTNRMKYFKFPLDSIENPNNRKYYCALGETTFVASQKLINNLRKFFNIMKKGNAYIGCQYGIDRTNKGITINYFLNNTQTTPKLLHWDYETPKAVVNRNVRVVKKIFGRLTPTQKDILELPYSIEDILRKKMPMFIKTNSDNI